MNDYPDIAAKALALCAAHDPWFPQPNRMTVTAWAEQIAVYQLGGRDVLDVVRTQPARRYRGNPFCPQRAVAQPETHYPHIPPRKVKKCMRIRVRRQQWLCPLASDGVPVAIVGDPAAIPPTLGAPQHPATTHDGRCRPPAKNGTEAPKNE